MEASSQGHPPLFLGAGRKAALTPNQQFNLFLPGSYVCFQMLVQSSFHSKTQVNSVSKTTHVPASGSGKGPECSLVPISADCPFAWDSARREHHEPGSRVGEAGVRAASPWVKSEARNLPRTAGAGEGALQGSKEGPAARGNMSPIEHG